MIVMDLGDGERILAHDPGTGITEALITVRPEWIKLDAGADDARMSVVSGTIADVVYLGSVTQLLIDLPTGDRLSVHRLNDSVDAVEHRPGERVRLRWAAEHSFVIGAPGPIAAGDAGAGPTPEPRPQGRVPTP